MTIPLPVHKHHTVHGVVDCHVHDCDVYAIQRAQRAGVELPRYTGAVIYSCPDCWGDLEHAGHTEYWCRACQRTFYFAEVVTWEDGQLDD